MYLPEVIFISFMSGLNVGLDLLISIPLKIILGHIIAGIFIMVPINFILITFTKLIADKHGTITLYLFIFSLLSIPTSLFGGVAGIYKIFVGLLIGLMLDIAFIPKKTSIKLLFGAIIGSILWWISLFTIWQLFQLPFVTGFSSMLNSASENYAGSIDLSRIVNLPIVGFGADFYLFAVLCGLLSSVPCLIARYGGYSLF